MDLFTASHTIFSPCRAYRYWLERRWGAGAMLGLLMLNPSTADEWTDDRTVAKVSRLARAMDYGGIVVCNLFALRSTDPTGLKKVADPIGPENDMHILLQFELCAKVIAAWGTHGTYLGRDAFVVKRLLSSGPLWCLKLTKSGHPQHPLYLPDSLRPIPFVPPSDGDQT